MYEGLVMRYKKNIRTVLCIIVVCVGLSSCGIGGFPLGKKPLSETVKGDWSAQVDVATMVYRGLSEELGFDISPNQSFCTFNITFEDEAFVYSIDIDEFSRALGECAEPYTSAFFGFDTGFIVDLIMAYVAKDIPLETGKEYGVYKVDNDNKTVELVVESGEQETLSLNDDGCLVYYDDFWGQDIIFEKKG